jgi:hypothetical protein
VGRAGTNDPEQPAAPSDRRARHGRALVAAGRLGSADL